MTHVIFLNGPPRSGKDTAAKMLARMLPRAAVYAMAEPLKRATHALFAALRGSGLSAPAVDAFENCKDEPNAFFFGLTPRRAYITTSEKLLKPSFGQDFFGRLLLRKVLARSSVSTWLFSSISTWLVSDSGFVPEIEVVAERIGANNCTVIQISREGKDYSGDSRSDVEIDGAALFKVSNNGTLDDLRARLVQVVAEMRR